MNIQQYTSKNTFVNHNRIPALFKRIEWKPNMINLDIGGGSSDIASNYLLSLGSTNLIYDPYNRSIEHNLVIKQLLLEKRPNTSTLSNVLCVIMECNIRTELLLFAKNNSDITFISIYEGDKTGIGRSTKRDCWQNNRKLSSYIKEVEDVFNFKIIVNKMIVAWDLINIDPYDFIKKKINKNKKT